MAIDPNIAAVDKAAGEAATAAGYGTNYQQGREAALHEQSAWQPLETFEAWQKIGFNGLRASMQDSMRRVAIAGAGGLELSPKNYQTLGDGQYTEARQKGLAPSAAQRKSNLYTPDALDKTGVKRFESSTGLAMLALTPDRATRQIEMWKWSKKAKRQDYQDALSEHSLDNLLLLQATNAQSTSEATDNDTARYTVKRRSSRKEGRSARMRPGGLQEAQALVRDESHPDRGQYAGKTYQIIEASNYNDLTLVDAHTGEVLSMKKEQNAEEQFASECEQAINARVQELATAYNEDRLSRDLKIVPEPTALELAIFEREKQLDKSWNKFEKQQEQQNNNQALEPRMQRALAKAMQAKQKAEIAVKQDPTNTAAKQQLVLASQSVADLEYLLADNTASDVVERYGETAILVENAGASAYSDFRVMPEHWFGSVSGGTRDEAVANIRDDMLLQIDSVRDQLKEQDEEVSPLQMIQEVRNSYEHELRTRKNNLGDHQMPEQEIQAHLSYFDDKVTQAFDKAKEAAREGRVAGDGMSINDDNTRAFNPY